MRRASASSRRTRRRSLEAAAESAHRGRVNPLPGVRLTRPQLSWVSTAARLALWRGGNQIGKSYGTAFDIVQAARGTHPYRQVRQRRGPVRLLVVSESWAQMDPLCDKLWSLLPKDEIDSRVSYEPGGGFRGFKEPHIPFTAGPGRGSVIVFATYKQGAKRIAGGSYHGAYLDEPPPETVFGEILPRLARFRGTLRVSMTPTPESPPLRYLREYVEKGKITELHTSVTLDAMTPLGGLFEGPWMRPEELEELVDSYLEVERGMRIHGDWDPIVAGRWFTAWNDGLVSSVYPRGSVWVAVGIDHGAKAGRQVASLTVCTDDGSRVFYLDEVRSDGRTSTREDARAILAMLRRHGFTWENVDYWVGDRAHGGDMWGNEKSNFDLLVALSEELSIPRRQLQHRGLKIATPRKFRGSMTRGIRLMNSLYKQGQATISPRCKGLIEGCRGWEGRRDDPLKDPIDAARYATEVLHDQRVLRPAVSRVGRIF